MMIKKLILFFISLFISNYISGQEPLLFDLKEYIHSLSPSVKEEVPDKKVIEQVIFPLGTHHSLSYVKPKWYWRPFNWMIKCQNLTIEQQLNCGVVYFDIRVRFQKGKVISGHGVINYDIDVLDILKKLNSHAAIHQPLFVRIMYESNPFYKNPTLEMMKDFMKQLMENYPDLTFTQCHIRSPYTLIGTYNDIPKQDYYQFYKDYGATTFRKKLRGLKFPFPQYYAKKNNETYWYMLHKNKINIVDFVDINLCPPKTYFKLIP